MALVNRLFNEPTNVLDLKLEMLKMTLSLLLHSLCNIEVLVTQNLVDTARLLEILGECEVTLQDWVQRTDVVGGQQFGNKMYRNTFVNGSTEFKVLLLNIMTNFMMEYFRCGETFYHLMFLNVKGWLIIGTGVLRK